MKLFGWELRKLFSRTDVRIGFAILILSSIFALVGAALGLQPEITSMMERVKLGLNPMPADFQRGLGFAATTLTSLSAPLILIIVSAIMASSITEEARTGAIHRLMTKSLSRTRLILTKFAAGSVYLCALVLVALIFNLVIPSMVLGGGKLYLGRTTEKVTENGITMGERPVILSSEGSAAQIRVASSYLLSVICLLPAVALSLLASSASRTSSTALIGSLGIGMAIWLLGTTKIMGSLSKYFSIFGHTAWASILNENMSAKSIILPMVLPIFALCLLLGSSIMVLGNREAPPSSNS